MSEKPPKMVVCRDLSKKDGQAILELRRYYNSKTNSKNVISAVHDCHRYRDLYENTANDLGVLQEEHDHLKDLIIQQDELAQTIRETVSKR